MPELDALPEQEAETARRRLARLDTACGCAEGAALAFAALILYLLIGMELVGGGGLAQAGIGAAIFILAAGAGKTLGLMRARYARDRLLDELHSRVALLVESRDGSGGRAERPG
jgi:hypothetical protein